MMSRAERERVETLDRGRREEMERAVKAEARVEELVASVEQLRSELGQANERAIAAERDRLHAVALLARYVRSERWDEKVGGGVRWNELAVYRNVVRLFLRTGPVDFDVPDDGRWMIEDLPFTMGFGDFEEVRSRPDPETQRRRVHAAVVLAQAEGREG